MAEASQKIGHIRLTEPLGEGGMGTVWKGWDEKLRREVAVKTLRADRLDLETRARLLAEARILSQLEHPNICRLYDYVEDEDNDYLVLELVRGSTLAQAIAAGLTDADPLRIAEEIARTLVVAHARGIVHRDLKPANVMLDDESGGQVKVLDFGLARSLDGKVDTAPAPPPDAGRTDAGRPDARAMSRRSVGSTDGTLTRLGSLMLQNEAGRVTGTPTNMSPEQARGERVTAASDMYSFGLLLQELFTGRSAYPPGLSLERLMTKATEGDTLPVEGTRRDVKALIEKLLALAPEERPAASEALAALRDVRERPKRRRRRLTAVTVVAAFALGGVKYAYDQKLGREREAEARKEAERATAFLTDLFTAADRWQQEEEPTVREVLDRGRERIATELTDQPRVRGHLLYTLGEVYTALGRFDDAEGLFREALAVNRTIFGPDSVEVVTTLHQLAATIHRAGRLDEAKALYLQALEIHESQPELAPGAMAEVLFDLANIYDERGEPTRPGVLYQRALKILEEDPESNADGLAALQFNMAVYYRNLGDDERAESLLLSTLELRERLFAPAFVAEALNSLGLLYSNRGDLSRAESVFQRALDLAEPALGGDDNLVLTLRHNFAFMMLAAGDLERAEALSREVVESRLRLGHRKDFTASIRHILALAVSQQGRYREAQRMLEESLAEWAEIRGEDHPRIGRMLRALAVVRHALGSTAEAEELLERALGIFAAALGEDHHYLTETRRQLARLALERGDGERALELLEAARDATMRRMEDKPENVRDSGRLAAVNLGLGDVAAAAGATADAEVHWQEALAILKPLDGRLTAEMRQTRALALLRLGRSEDARPLVEELLGKGWHDAELMEAAERARGVDARG